MGDRGVPVERGKGKKKKERKGEASLATCSPLIVVYHSISKLLTVTKDE
jgi:hypothetical protein